MSAYFRLEPALPTAARANAVVRHLRRYGFHHAGQEYGRGTEVFVTVPAGPIESAPRELRELNLYCAGTVPGTWRYVDDSGKVHDIAPAVTPAEGWPRVPSAQRRAMSKAP